MPQGHDPYAILIEYAKSGSTKAERIERGKRALVEAVAVQACMWAKTRGRSVEAREWLRDPAVGGGKWWLEQVLQMDYADILERIGMKP